MKRIQVLDLWRSLCIVLMLVYHAFYDLELTGVLAAGTMQRPAALAAGWICGGGFILLSGAVARFSRSAARRGFAVFCAGVLVSAATALVGLPVKFGVLQLLGVCMMLFGALRPRLEPHLGARLALGCAVLFVVTAWLTSAIRVDIMFVYPLGLRSASFYSSDYYPLLPWAFLFLIGACLGKYLESRADAPLLRRAFPAVLTFPGRHSLLIYLLHQPILYGACKLMLG